MRKTQKIIVFMAFVCILGIVLGLWVYLYPTGDTDRRPASQNAGKGATNKEREPVASGNVKELTTMTDIPALPLSSMSKEEIAKRYYGLRDSSNEIRDGLADRVKMGKCPYRYLYDRKTKTWMDGGYGMSLDTPMVELRFRRPGPEGELDPFPVQSVRFYPAWNGRTHKPRDGECSFMTCFDGLDYKFSYAVRFWLSESFSTYKWPVILLGQKYYVIFYHSGYYNRRRTPDKWGSALIQIPEEVPRGKMAVFTVDVTERAENWADPNSYNQISKKKVKIDARVRGTDKRVRAALYDRSAGFPRQTRLEGGEGEIEVLKLGGEMVVGVGGETDGHMLYYMRSVQDTEVTFPRDADFAAEPDEVLSFRLKVPQQRVPHDALGLSLLMHRDSKLPVAGTEFTNVSGWRRSSKKPPESVPMNAPPGQYYVGYGRDPEEIGKVTVKKSDAGKTLEVHPLEE